MPTHSADPSILRNLAALLETQSGDLSDSNGSIAGVLMSHGCWSQMVSVCNAIEQSTSWASAWAASLRSRAAVLERNDAVPLAMRRAEGLQDAWISEGAWAVGGAALTYEAWIRQQSGADGTEPDPDAIEALERHIAALKAGEYNDYVGMAIYYAAQRVRTLRIEKLRKLEEDLARLSDGSPHRIDVRAELVSLGADLGLTTDGFAAAADAMIEGISPADARLDPLYFPWWYIEAHERHRSLTTQRAEAEAQTQLLFDEILEIQASGAPYTDEDIRPQLDEATALSRLVASLGEKIDDVVHLLTVERAIVAAYLDDLLLVDNDAQHTLLGEFLAGQIHQWAGHHAEMMELSALVGLHVDSSGEAVAMFNAMPPHLVAAMPYASSIHNAHAADLIAFMEPFSRALAWASHSSDLDIDEAALVNAPDAGLWFVHGHTYSTPFAIEAAIGAVAVNESWFNWPSKAALVAGGETTLDPRVSLLSDLAARGPVVAQATVSALAGAGILHEFLNPTTTYEDGGQAAGALLALLGTGMDRAAAELVLEVMFAVGEASGPAAVLQGAALMAVPHIGSFATDFAADTVKGTPLGETLDLLGDEDRGLAIDGYLEAVMVNDVAASHLFTGLSLVMVDAFGSVLNGEIDLSLSEPAWETGQLADLLIDAYLHVHTEEAASLDQKKALLHSVASTAIDLILAAGIAAAGPGLVAGIVLEVVAASGANIAIPLMTDFGLEANNVEEVLAGGYELENDIVTHAALIVAAGLHARGVVELPESWFANGELVTPDTAAIVDWLNDIETGDFKPSELFGPVFGIGGLIGSGGPPGND